MYPTVIKNQIILNYIPCEIKTKVMAGSYAHPYNT